MPRGPVDRCGSGPTMSIDAWLQQVWYGTRAPPWWLRIWSPVYGAVVCCRHWLYRRGWLRAYRGRRARDRGRQRDRRRHRQDAVRDLAGRQAARLGLAVAVVTRGYGRSRSRRVTNDILRVDGSCRAEDVGDEALLISRRALCPVYVCRDRVAAARAAVGRWRRGRDRRRWSAAPAAGPRRRDRADRCHARLWQRHAAARGAAARRRRRAWRAPRPSCSPALAQRRRRIWRAGPRA